MQDFINSLNKQLENNLKKYPKDSLFKVLIFLYQNYYLNILYITRIFILNLKEF